MSKRIDVKELKLGMYVENLDRPWLDSPFLFQGFTVDDPEDLQTLRGLCRYVYVADDSGNAKGNGNAVTATPSVDNSFSGDLRKPSVPQAARIQRVLGETRVLCQEATTLVNDLQNKVQQGQSVDPAEAKEIVQELADSIYRTPEALIWFTHLKHRDRYTATHSLNVCILALSFARHLGWTREALCRLGVGALLHDLGKLRIPLAILNKPGRLDDDEMATMRRHPTLGVDILHNTRHLCAEGVSVVRSHHERLDGRGYPDGLQSKDLGLFPQLVTITDVYDALTSDRSYKRGLAPRQALDIMLKDQGQAFAAKLLQQWIDCIGVYPPGSLLAMNSGEIGVVLPTQRKDSDLIVLLILDPDGNRYFPLRILDFRLLKGEPQRYIREALPPGSQGINPDEFATEVFS